MNKKVLICDDDEGILDATRMILEDAGYHVDILTTCAGFREKVKKYKPDIMLVDLWLPGISGEEAASQLKKDPSLSKIPIIIMSANRETEAIAKKVNADAYLCKPYDISDLLATVQRLTQD